MLYVFFGKNSVAVREKAHTFLESQEATHGPAERLTSENFIPGSLGEWAGAVGLFDERCVILLDTLSEHEDALDEVIEHAESLASSTNIFVLIEQKLLAAPTKAFKKHAAEFTEVEGDAEDTSRFNTFALADAFARRDKRSLWLLFIEAGKAGVMPEEIAGVLFWQVKALRLAQHTKTAREAGMKDYPYKKAQGALKKFKKDELDVLSRKLISIYHDGHLGKRDLDLALERFVLSV